ncbi:right-handed parallel beta-helix repeat-containing protein, partial [bacterium]|nr:right-handed parallel beta-helix repeat-containing protein [candidate division CSSED10-310 bacterium]
LDDCDAGDTVLVEPGTYQEALVWPEVDNLILGGEEFAVQTFVQAVGNNRAFTRIGGNLLEISLRRLTFTGGDADAKGGGLYISSAELEIEGCVISYNHADEEGGGAFIRDSTILLDDCVIKGNDTGLPGEDAADGLGLYLLNCEGEVRDCIIRDHSNLNMRGAGVFCTGGVTFTGNLFENNDHTGTDGGGGALSLTGGGVIGGNVFRGNAGIGAAVLVTDPDTVISNNLFLDNTAATGSGAIQTVTATTITFNTFDGNLPAAVACLACDLVVENSILTGSTIAIFNQGGTISSDYNDYWNNGLALHNSVPGEHDLFLDPRFVSRFSDDHYLSQIAAGQGQDSPCVDTADPETGGPGGTTRTDQVPDSHPPDMGYHYPITGSATPTPSPSPTPRDTETPAPTPEPNLTILITTNSQFFSPDDLFILRLLIDNPGPGFDAHLYVALDIAGMLFFYPSWAGYPPDIDYQPISIWADGVFSGTLLEFPWPEGAGSGTAGFYAALLDETDVTLLALDSCNFSFEP